MMQFMYTVEVVTENPPWIPPAIEGVTYTENQRGFVQAPDLVRARILVKELYAGITIDALIVTAASG
jgi:hypothetical protein